MLQHKTLIAVTTPCAPWSDKGCMMRESGLSAVCLGRTLHFYGEADEQQTCVELFLRGVCFSCLGCCCASYRTKTHVNESFQIYPLMKSCREQEGQVFRALSTGLPDDFACCLCVETKAIQTLQTCLLWSCQ